MGYILINFIAIPHTISNHGISPSDISYPHFTSTQCKYKLILSRYYQTVTFTGAYIS